MKIINLLFFIIIARNDFALAQPGSLDQTFGNGGIVITDFNGSFDNGHSIAIQGDNKILVAGSTYDSSIKVALVRYNIDGSLDSAFGLGGKVTTIIGSYDDYGRAICIKQDGRIVVAGSSQNSNGTGDFALFSYNNNGTLDTSFGNGGMVTTSFSSQRDEATSIALQSDGKIVVAGIENSSQPSGHFAIARYNDNGTLDSTFGSSGKVITSFGVWDAASALAIQSNGKIIVTGPMSVSLSSFTAQNFATCRYNNDGTLDSTFGLNGKVITDIAGPDYWGSGYSIAIQADGKIIVGGTSGDIFMNNFTLVRYNNNGSIDSTFGSGGFAVTSIGNGSSNINSVVLSNDGKIIAAGVCRIGSTYRDFGLVCYSTDGIPDSTFGISGKVITSIGNSDDFALCAAIQSDGKILVAGYTDNGINNDFTLVRYNYNTVGINEVSNFQSPVNIYPNPTQNKFIIELNKELNNFMLQIYNLNGEIIYSGQNLNSKTFTINQSFPSGIYFVKVTDGENIYSQKLIIH